MTADIITGAFPQRARAAHAAAAPPAAPVDPAALTPEQERTVAAISALTAALAHAVAVLGADPACIITMRLLTQMLPPNAAVASVIATTPPHQP